jgi:anaerobic selenocysteine-containing dehydrogenase
MTATADGVYPTTCWECSTCCGALAKVEGGRVTDYGPNPGHPYSKGAFCIKGIRASRASGAHPASPTDPTGCCIRCAAWAHVVKGSGRA